MKCRFCGSFGDGICADDAEVAGCPNRPLTDDEEFVLSLLDEHGAMRFTVAADISACHALQRTGLIADHGSSGAKELTRIGAIRARQAA